LHSCPTRRSSDPDQPLAEVHALAAQFLGDRLIGIALTDVQLLRQMEFDRVGFAEQKLLVRPQLEVAPGTLVVVGFAHCVSSSGICPAIYSAVFFSHLQTGSQLRGLPT